MSTTTTEQLMAEATGSTITEFSSSERVVFLTRDGEPVLVDSEELLAALEKEFTSCIHSMPGLTWVKDLDEDTAGWRFEDHEAGPGEDPNATLFLFTEAGRYLSLMRSVAAAFSDEDLDPYAWSSLSELEDLLAYYQQAVEYAMRQQQEVA